MNLISLGLILVLLDDGLVHIAFMAMATDPTVLILVLLDDGLVHQALNKNCPLIVSLNPCFVGRWTSTRYLKFFRSMLFQS